MWAPGWFRSTRFCSGAHYIYHDHDKTRSWPSISCNSFPDYEQSYHCGGRIWDRTAVSPGLDRDLDTPLGLPIGHTPSKATLLRSSLACTLKHTMDHSAAPKTGYRIDFLLVLLPLQPTSLASERKLRTPCMMEGGDSKHPGASATMSVELTLSLSLLQIAEMLMII